MKKSMISFRCYILILCFFISVTVRSQLAQPVLCFDFSGNLDATNSNVSLNSIGDTGQFVNGFSECNENTLYTWSISTGLKLQNPVNYFPQNHYTIELLFKFTTQPYPSSWQKIIDFKNQTSDMGLYLYHDNLQMYGQYTGRIIYYN